MTTQLLPAGWVIVSSIVCEYFQEVTRSGSRCCRHSYASLVRQLKSAESAHKHKLSGSLAPESKAPTVHVIRALSTWLIIRRLSCASFWQNLRYVYSEQSHHLQCLCFGKTLFHKNRTWIYQANWSQHTLRGSTSFSAFSIRASWSCFSKFSEVFPGAGFMEGLWLSFATISHVHLPFQVLKATIPCPRREQIQGATHDIADLCQIVCRSHELILEHCMKNISASHSYISFRSRDLTLLFHKRWQFDMAPRNLHPACQGMR